MSGDNDENKFRRDGAKYVCRKCKSKYFTRAEVVECFDGHDKEESKAV